ncbi:hypothetical protein BJV82DRAFT_625035 [Fennellomyces sp. T-0311]|nr:hypothetical protein BJV82DRAFT_625035 [Fennellomyces sp. T-0311]
MSTTTDVDVLTNEWVKKIHFENRVDLNLQLPAAGESAKIEIPELPSFDNIGTIDLPDKQQKQPSAATTTTDSYLNAIVSSPASKPSTTCTSGADCSCYKCQRQKRRARVNKTAPETPVSKPAAPPPTTKATIISSTRTTPASREPAYQQPQQPRSAPPVSQQSMPSKTGIATKADPQQPSQPSNSKRSQGSIYKRKTPSVKSYDKHMPRPTYSAQDSIYRTAQGDVQNSHLSNQQPKNTLDYADNYQISWKDDATGDDLLGSLKTFQHIFAEQPTENTQGLSDLLEVRARELKRQREEQANQAAATPVDPDEMLTEPPAGQVFTLKYRKGSPHYALTLYHTMKMQGASERMAAYSTAFGHCMRANSGLSGWLKMQSRREPPRVLQEYRPRPKKPTKKSILSPIIPGKKKTTTDDMWYKISSSENPAPALPPSNPWNSDDSTAITPTDVLSAAHALLPNQSPVALHDSLSRSNIAAKPYDHVDTPSRPIPTHVSKTKQRCAHGAAI